MKKNYVLAVILLLCLLWTVFPGAAHAAEIVDSGSCGENLTWTLDDEGTLTITGTGPMSDYDSVSEYPWYGQRDSIRTIIIEDGVTSIGDDAFRGCSSLTSVTIAVSVTSIGDYTFTDCYDLSSVTISHGVASIGESMFCNCGSLESIVIPDSVTSIGNSAFSLCDLLTTVIIGENMTTISDDAFRYCDRLTNVFYKGNSSGKEGISVGANNDTLSNATWHYEVEVQQQNGTTFVYCPDCDLTFNSEGEPLEGTCGDDIKWSLDYAGTLTISGTGSMENYDHYGSPWYSRDDIKAIIITEGISSIGNNAFQDCDGLTTVCIPDNVTSIGEYAFVNSSNLTAVVIPDSVTTIGNYAFGGCNSLNTVTISNSVTMIGDGVFKSCDLTSVIIPDSVTAVGSYAFSYCDRLTSVTIPDSVTSIGDHAFCECRSLTTVTIPDSVTSIDTGAFYKCTSLTSVIIPDSITVINSYTFSATNMTAIVIPDTITLVDHYAIGDCHKLTDIFYKGTTLQKADIVMTQFNEDLTEATWHYEVEVLEHAGKTVIYCPECDCFYNPNGAVVEIPLAITTQPKTTYAKSGGTAKATVKAVGDGLNYQWYVKNAGASKFTKSSITSATYSTKMNDKSKDRQVYCVVTDKYGNTAKSKTVYLRMAASVTTQPKSAYVKSGSTAKVTVQAAGDGLTYQWYVKSVGDSKYYKSSVTSATYATKMNDKSAERLLYCVVTDKYGNTVKSKTVALHMTATILTQPKTAYGKSGSVVKTTVKADGEGLSYQWYVKNAGSSKFTKSSVTSATYAAKMNDKSKDRAVYCVVTDKYGKTVKTNTVYLRMAATITSQPVSVSVNEGEKATAKVKAVGDGLTYQWYFADAGSDTFHLTTTFTGTTYSVTMNSARDGRRVYCVVTDKYGKTVKSNTVTISMK